jgi:hypothetical protein
MATGLDASSRRPGQNARCCAVSTRGLLGLMLAASLAGCGRAAPVRIRYVFHHALKTYGDCTQGHDRCTRITLRWPTVATGRSPAGADSITAFVRSRLCQSYDGSTQLPNEDSVMVGFIEVYRAFASSAPGGPSSPWDFERRIEPLGDTLGVASLAVTEQAFLGGAHPNSTTLFANFDLASGRMLKRSDLLLDSGREQLDRIGERAFRRVRKLARDADLNAAGFWFEGGRFKLNENFAVTPTGLLFFFNPYEIGPYVFGATSITLPWADVMPLVRTDGPLWVKGRR